MVPSAMIMRPCPLPSVSLSGQLLRLSDAPEQFLPRAMSTGFTLPFVLHCKQPVDSCGFLIHAGQEPHCLTSHCSLSKLAVNCSGRGDLSRLLQSRER